MRKNMGYCITNPSKMKVVGSHVFRSRIYSKKPEGTPRVGGFKTWPYLTKKNVRQWNLVNLFIQCDQCGKNLPQECGEKAKRKGVLAKS